MFGQANDGRHLAAFILRRIGPRAPDSRSQRVGCLAALGGDFAARLASATIDIRNRRRRSALFER
jgi:hypothetical protein